MNLHEMKVCCAFRERKMSTIWLKEWALCSKHSLFSFFVHRKINLLYTQERAWRKFIFSFLWRCKFPTEDGFSHVAVSFWNLGTFFFSQLVACSHINPIKISCFAPDWHWSISDRHRLVPAPEDWFHLPCAATKALVSWEGRRQSSDLLWSY